MDTPHTESNAMNVRRLALGPIVTNCYVIRCAATGKGAVVDASDEPERILGMIGTDPPVEVVRLLQTHAHVDHVGGLAGVKTKLDVPILLHREDLPLYRAAPVQGRMFGINIPTLPEPDQYVEDGDIIQIGELRAQVLHTPGHAPGAVCYWFEEQAVLFTGDLLFAGSIGRTDLPGGDMQTMWKSLQRVAGLPAETAVFSGHGPETTIGREKQTNPFLRSL